MSAAVTSAHLDDVLARVWDDAEGRGFAGWDPYDGLNSRFFRATPFFRIPKARQAWIQVVKRSPLNLRPIFGQSPEVLAKGLALFALGAWRLADRGGADAPAWRSRGTELLAHLDRLRSPGFDDHCWGYPYDWQSRAFFQPRNSPNLICSVFAAMAFERRTDGGDRTTRPAEVRRFIERHLWREKGDVKWITYTPTTDTQVHNVNMLGAALLARGAGKGGSGDVAGGSGSVAAGEAGSAAAGGAADAARVAMRFSVDRLRADGSWPYGEAPNQAWVDNFHTGYNLVALEDYRATTGDTLMDETLEKAYRYWDRTFIRADGAPGYYSGSFWPVDIHSAAMAILTYLFCDRLDPDAVTKARRVADWTLQHLWDGRRNFIFQKTGWYDNKVPQIRWGQAWMFWALAELAARSEGENSPRQ
jgi:hypothetical protein